MGALTVRVGASVAGHKEAWPGVQRQRPVTHLNQEEFCTGRPKLCSDLITQVCFSSLMSYGARHSCFLMANQGFAYQSRVASTSALATSAMSDSSFFLPSLSLAYPDGSAFLHSSSAHSPTMSGKAGSANKCLMT